jgi:hypothetical protein
LAYFYQKAALISLLWTECHGFGRARPLLDEALEAVIQEAEGIYTADAVAALCLLQSDLRRPLWDGQQPLITDVQEGEDDGKSVDG